MINFFKLNIIAVLMFLLSALNSSAASTSPIPPHTPQLEAESFVSSPVQITAGIYWLPDYLKDNLDRNSNGSNPSPEGGDKDNACSDYGFQSTKPDANLYDFDTKANVTTDDNGNWITCYDNVKCKTKFQYTSTNCNGDKKPTGASCGGKYETCQILECSSGFTKDLTSCPNTTGYTYSTGTPAGTDVCGKCTAKTCPSGSSTSTTCDNVNTKCTLTGYSGTSPCYSSTNIPCPTGKTNCTYGCGTYDSSRVAMCGQICTECKTCTPNCTSQNSCVYGSYAVDNGCGGTCTKCKKGGIIFTFAPATKNINLDIKYSNGAICNLKPDGTRDTYKINVQIDWGDGNITEETDYISCGETITKSHKYTVSGSYDVSINGNMTTLKTFNDDAKPYIIGIKSLNLPSITNFDSTFRNCVNLSGTIPPLPANLKIAVEMFEYAKKLTGNIPNLPSTLENARYMFNGCEGLSGSIPPLPRNLSVGMNMFAYCKNLSGTIPELPFGLIDAHGMFVNCSRLTGSIPYLPDNIETSSYMFAGATGLTGNIPNIPTSITNSHRMFEGASNISGNIPNPSSITSAAITEDPQAVWAMFCSCPKLIRNNNWHPYSYNCG